MKSIIVRENLAWFVADNNASVRYSTLNGQFNCVTTDGEPMWTPFIDVVRHMVSEDDFRKLKTVVDDLMECKPFYEVNRMKLKIFPECVRLDSGSVRLIEWDRLKERLRVQIGQANTIESGELGSIYETLSSDVCDVFRQACSLDVCDTRWKITCRGQVFRDGRRVDVAPQEIEDLASEFSSLFQ